MTLLRGITVAMGDIASNITSHVASAADVMQPQHLLRSDTSQSSFSRILEERDNMSIIDDDTFVSNNDSDLGLRQNLNQLLRSQWHLQNLGMPFEGAHTGLAVYDLNGDGYEDILFAAGRHQIDTAYALINLGPADPSGESLDIRFSEPLTLRTGTFYQVDVSPLSSLEEGHVAVLLAGGSCWICSELYQPARLLDVYATGCSVNNPDAPCELWVKSEVLWQEPGREDSGNRNGQLSMELGNGVDPAIVLVGTGGLSIYHPRGDGTYNANFPDYLLRSEDKITEFDDAIDRSVGLAIGKIGKQTGIVLGTRSASQAPGAVAIVVVYQEQTSDGEYVYTRWNVDGDTPDFYADSRVSLQKTGVALADINGDGNVDIVTTSYLNGWDIDPDVKIKHTFMLVDEDPSDNAPLPEKTVFGSSFPGRSVAAGKLFMDSDLPDLVFAMASGELIFFANQGVDEKGDFNGFRGKGKLRAVADDCQIRDVKIVSFVPCTQSVVTAITCGYGVEGSDNVVFTTRFPCDMDAATNIAANTTPLETTSTLTPSVSPVTEPPSGGSSSLPSTFPVSNTPVKLAPSNQMNDPLVTSDDNCRTGLVPLNISIMTDNFPEDILWTVSNDMTGEVVGSKQGFDELNTLYNDMLCVYQNNVYTFTIYDANDDAICCDNGNGYFSLTVEGIEMYVGGEGFGSQFDYTFVVPTGYCDIGESLLEISLMTDLWETDSSWILVNDQLNETVASGGSYSDKNTLYIEPFCIAQNQAYTFTLYDGGNDSLCCQYGNGYYVVAVDGNELFRGGEDFGSKIQHTFYVSPNA
jgi:hypothetical protein